MEDQQDWAALVDGTSSIVAGLDGELNEVLDEETSEDNSSDTSTEDDSDEGTDSEDDGEDGWEAASAAALQSLAQFAASWVTTSGEPTDGGTSVTVVPAWSFDLFARTRGETGVPYDPHLVSVRFPGQVEFSGLGLIEITTSDGSSGIVDLTPAHTIQDVVNAINDTPIPVVGQLHEDGRGFDLIDLTLHFLTLVCC